MNRHGLAALLLSVPAGAQATHNGYIWIEGPADVLPDSTFTLNVWGQFDSPAFIDGTSAIAGFRMDIICTEGRGQIVDVSGPGAHNGIILNSGVSVGPDLYDVSGGQIANVFGINPVINLDSPLLLFSFDVTVAAFTHFAFEPMSSAPDGALSFYPDSTDTDRITAPGDPDTSIHFAGLEYGVPAPWGLMLGGLAMCTQGRRRRRRETRLPTGVGRDAHEWSHRSIPGLRVRGGRRGAGHAQRFYLDRRARRRA